MSTIIIILICLNLVTTSGGSKTKCKLEEFHDHDQKEFNYICNNTKTSFTLFKFTFHSPFYNEPNFFQLHCIGSKNEFKNLDEYEMNSVSDELGHLHWKNGVETDFIINDNYDTKCIDKNGGWSKINSLINSNALSTLKHNITFLKIESNANDEDYVLELPGKIKESFPKIENLMLMHVDKIISSNNIDKQQWPLNLRTLNIENSRENIFPPAFSDSHISYLELSDMKILTNIDNVVHMKELENLIIDKAPKLKIIPFGIFNGPKNLSNLELHDNSGPLQFDSTSLDGISKLYMKNVILDFTNPPTVFKNLTDIKWVNVKVMMNTSANEWKSECKFPNDFFQNLNPEIKSLNIPAKHNCKYLLKGKDIQKLTELKKLQVLHLNSTTVGEETCDCQVRQNLVKLNMALNDTILTNSNLTKCINSESLSYDCLFARASTLIVAILSCIILLICGLLCCIYRRYVPKFPGDSPHQHVHDVFVIFHYADAKVLAKMIQKMKDLKSYDIVHEYNYKAGLSNEENLKEFMKKSKRIVILVSNKFLKDRQYDLKTAFSNHKKRLIPIFIGKNWGVIDNIGDIPLRKYLQQRGHLYYDYGRESFWDKLQLHLPNPPNVSKLLRKNVISKCCPIPPAPVPPETHQSSPYSGRITSIDLGGGSNTVRTITSAFPRVPSHEPSDSETLTLVDLKNNEEHIGEISRLLGDAWQNIMGEIRSLKFPEQDRFKPRDVNLLKNSHQPFLDFIKNWSTMGKIRRPLVSDLLVICYDIKQVETAIYIYRKVMVQDGELNENTLLKYRQNKWGEGVNSEIFDFKNFENTDTPKDVPYSSLQWITHNFSEHRIVSSEGACSNVYWANLPNGAGGLKIAIKKFKYGPGLLVQNMKDVEKMLQIEKKLAELKPNPNIIKLLGYSKTNKDACLIYPFFKNGTLKDILDKTRNDQFKLSAEERFKIMAGIARGIHHIHASDQHHVHRDIKPGNILLNDQFDPIICDFGLLYDLDLSIDRTSTQFQGTRSYAPIEVFQSTNNIPTTKWDVFSFGVIMLELLSGLSNIDKFRSPIPGVNRSPDNQLRLHLRNIPDDFIVNILDSKAGWDEDLAKRLYKYALRCTSDDPSNRDDMQSFITEFLANN